MPDTIVAPPTVPPNAAAPAPTAPPVTPPAAETPASTVLTAPETPPAKVVPEKYDLKPPEGALLDSADIERTAAYAKERGLSNEEAQALLERDNTIIVAQMEKQKELLKKTTDGWMAQLKADKEIGGAAFNESAELAKRIVAKYASPELKEALDSTGIGNHPELVRMLVKIGKSMANDKLVPSGNPPPEPKPIENRVYPNLK